MLSEMPPIVVSPSSSVVFVRTPSAAGQVQLPLANGITGRVITIKDIYGNLRNNTITVQTTGTNVFEDGTANYTVSQSFGNYTFMSDGINTWYRIAGSSNTDMNIQNLTVSTIYGNGVGLYNLNYVSSTQLESTIIGLGSLGYISTVGAADVTRFNLASTVQGLGSSGYLSSFSTAVFQGGLTSTIQGLGSLGYISTVGAADVTRFNLASTVQGLGSSGYLSSFSTAVFQGGLTSTIQGLGSLGYISTVGAADVTRFNLASTVEGLGSSGYLSSFSTAVFQGGLTSTIQGLGSLGYISTVGAADVTRFNLASTVEGLGSSGYLSSFSTAVFQGGLTSSLQGLGSSGYLSSFSTAVFQGGLTSSLEGLGSSGYLSSFSTTVFQRGLTSSLQGLGSSGYLSSFSTTVFQRGLTSSLQGLGSLGYVSSTQLASTVLGIENYINADITSTIVGLGSSGYLSSFSTAVFEQDLTSSLQGLGSLDYVSSTQLASTVLGLENYINADFTSTIVGLGSSGYLSSFSTTVFEQDLVSTVEGLGSYGYLSSFSTTVFEQGLVSTVEGLGSYGYLSSFSTTVFEEGLASTIEGLGSFGFLSSFISSFIDFNATKLTATNIDTINLNTSTVSTNIVDFKSNVGQVPSINLTKINKIITGFGNLLYAVGTGVGNVAIQTSINGRSWTNDVFSDYATLETVNDIVYVNSNLLIATGIKDGYPLSTIIINSNSGWSSMGSGLIEGKSIAYHESTIIVVGKTADNYSTLVISRDTGLTWTPSNIGYSQLNSITYTEALIPSTTTNFGFYPLYNSDPNTLFISTLSTISRLGSDLLPSTINVIKTYSNISSPNFTNVDITLLGGEGNNSLVMSLDNCITFSSLGGHTFSTVNAIAFSTNFWAVAGYTDGTSNGTIKTTYNLSEWTTAPTPLTIASDIMYVSEVVDPAYPPNPPDAWVAVGYTDGTSNGTLQVTRDWTTWNIGDSNMYETPLTWARSVAYSMSTGVYAIVGTTDGTTSNTLQLLNYPIGAGGSSVFYGVNNCLTTGHKIRYASNINRFIAVGEGPLFSAMVIYPKPANGADSDPIFTDPNLWRGQITPFTSAKDVTSFCSSNDDYFQYFITGESPSSNTSIVTAKLPIQETTLFNKTSFEWIPQPSALQNGTAIAYDSNTSNLYVGGDTVSTFNIPYWIAVGNTLPYVDSYNNPLYSQMQVYSSFSSLKDNVQVPLDTYVNTETLSTNLVSISNVTVLKRLSNTFIAGYGTATDDNIGPHILRTSFDGRTWGSTITVDTDDKLTVISAIEYSGSLWMVGGTADEAGTTALQTSADLETWTARTTGLEYIRTIVYGSNLWLAGGVRITNEVGPLKRSSDGFTWIDTPIDTNSILDIKYGNNVYIACGTTVIDSNSIGTISRSTDGTTWTAATLDNTIHVVYKISYNGSNRWAAIATETDVTGGTILISSNDGQTWVKRAKIQYSFDGYVRNLIFRNTSWGGEWLLHSTESPYYKSLYKSENNGDTWVAVDTHFSNINAICPASESNNAPVFMLGTAVNNSSNIFVSNDGEKWNASYVELENIKVVHTVNTSNLIDTCILGTSTNGIYYASLSTFGNNFSTYGLEFVEGSQTIPLNINSITTFKEGDTDYVTIASEVEDSGNFSLQGAYITLNLTDFVGIIPQVEAGQNLIHTIAYNSNTNRYIAGGYHTQVILESFTSNISYDGPWNYNTVRPTSNNFYVFDDKIYVNNVFQDLNIRSTFRTSYLELYNNNPTPYPYVSTSLNEGNVLIRDFSYLYAGGTNGIVRSSDGINWSSVYTTINCKAAATNFSSITAFVGTDSVLGSNPILVTVTSNTIWREISIPHITTPYTIKYDRYASAYDNASQTFSGINYWLIGGEGNGTSNSCSLVISEDLISFGGVSNVLSTCYAVQLIGDVEYSPNTNASYVKGGKWLLGGVGEESNAQGQLYNLQITSNYGNTWTGIPVNMSSVRAIAGRPANSNLAYTSNTYIIGGVGNGTSNSTLQIANESLTGFSSLTTIFKEVSYIGCVSTFFVVSGSNEADEPIFSISEDRLFWASSISTMFSNVRGIIYNDPPQNNNYTAIGEVGSNFTAGYGAIQHISSPYNWGYTSSPLAYENYNKHISSLLQILDNDLYINQNRYTNQISSLQINTGTIQSLNSYMGSIYHSYSIL